MAYRGHKHKHLVIIAVAVCVLLLLQLAEVDADAVSWNYQTSSLYGPDKWYLQFPDCGGVSQSPVDLNSSEILYDPNLELFDFSDYTITNNVTMVLENVGGHTAEVLYSGRKLYLKGGGLPDEYHLTQFHFHWGRVDSRGSEHSHDGYHYPMELHIVHQQKHLDNQSTVASHPAGLAVVAFFFKVGKENPKYKQLLDYFQYIRNATEPDSNYTIPTFALMDLLPNSQRYDYFRYQGSLTTPPCYESVIWSIGVDPIEISEDQVNMFRGLYDEEHHVLADDFRPIQKINQRSVLTTHLLYKPRYQCGTGSVVKPYISVFVLVLLSFVLYLF